MNIRPVIAVRVELIALLLCMHSLANNLTLELQDYKLPSAARKPCIFLTAYNSANCKNSHQKPSFLIFKKILNWRVIALQCFVGFCRPTMQVVITIYICVCIYIPSPLNILPTPQFHPSSISHYHV